MNDKYVTAACKALEAAISAGSFANKTRQKECLDYLNRSYDIERNVVRDWSLKNAPKDHSDARYDFLNAYDMPFELHNARPAHIKIAASVDAAVAGRIEDLIKMREMTKSLGFVTKEKAAEVKKTAAQLKYDAAMATVVAQAVLPKREEVIAHTKQECLDYRARLTAEVAEKGLAVVAPVPAIRPEWDRKVAYAVFKKEREAYENAADYRRHVAAILGDKGFKNYLDFEIHQVNASFNAYVFKLATKITGVKAARLADSTAIWRGSTLIVTMNDGTEQRWVTTMILNRSVLGKLFNQWPTRRV